MLLNAASCQCYWKLVLGSLRCFRQFILCPVIRLTQLRAPELSYMYISPRVRTEPFLATKYVFPLAETLQVLWRQAISGSLCSDASPVGHSRPHQSRTASFGPVAAATQPFPSRARPGTPGRGNLGHESPGKNI